MNKKILIGTVAVFTVIILAGAAFLAARLINQQGAGLAAQNLMMPGAGGGGPVRREFQLNIKNASEIPARTADLTGIITAVNDKTLTVGANPEFSITDDGGEPRVKVNTTGPTTEVVVTNETQVYLDTTFANPPDGVPNEDEQIQQVVEAADSSVFEKDVSVSVWGQKRGDRLIAELVLVSRPVTVMQRPGSN